MIPPSRMPEIVFLDRTDYSEVWEGDEIQRAITFYDKNGNHYVSENQYVCSLSVEELVREYAAGNLDDKIEYHTSCDVGELRKNYQKLYRLGKNKKLDIVHPEMMPDVQDINVNWYGIYYNRAGQLEVIHIHERTRDTHCYANDKRANEIYEWYIGTFQKKKK